ncbi:MAG: 16S rRNA (uracil(1498)-N(3))-methyltransferase [Flavobacteriales bacterium]
MKVFYFHNTNEERVILDEEESAHAVRVLRLKEGDEVHLIDGEGGFFKAQITLAHSKKCELQILSQEQVYKRKYYKHIAIAPPKSIDRFEWFLEKATEIGVDEITPLLTDRSERKNLNNERLEKILTSTMKQCIQPFRPKLNELTRYSDFISKNKNGYIAHLETGEEELLQKIYQPGSDCLILIGPEGDFSPAEVKSAKENGYVSISLGHSRLRVETAGVAACHTITVVNND